MIKQLKLIDQLHPIDVIVAKKKKGLARVLDHYIIYLGNGVFIGNLRGSVKTISLKELHELLIDYEPVRIRRFSGNRFDVQNAINRAYQRLGQKYSYLGFNCEHYANWVQHGKEKSSQVTNGLLILAGLVTIKLIGNGEGKR